MTAPRVVGLDLSLTSTGVASDTGRRCICTTSSFELTARLAHIRAGVDDATLNADVVVIEDYVTRSPAASVLGMVHGVVRLLMHDLGRPVALVPPSTLKKFATGRGNASKSDMRMAVYKRWCVDITDDNECDAYVLRQMAVAHYEPDVWPSQLRQKALDAVTWPDLEETTR